MKYIIIAILLYFIYLVVKIIIRSINGSKEIKTQNPKDTSQKRTYDVNKIQDAEFREVKKD